MAQAGLASLERFIKEGSYLACLHAGKLKSDRIIHKQIPNAGSQDADVVVAWVASQKIKIFF